MPSPASPFFGGWPPASMVAVPAVAGDSAITKPDVGARPYWVTPDGLLRVMLTDGTSVDVGPFAPPSDTSIKVRAIASIDGEGVTPTILFQLGDSEAHPGQNLFTGATKGSTGTYSLATTASGLGYNDTVVAVTARPLVAGGARVIANYSLSNGPSIVVVTELDDGTLVDASFSIIVYTTAG